MYVAEELSPYQAFVAASGDVLVNYFSVFVLVALIMLIIADYKRRREEFQSYIDTMPPDVFILKVMRKRK